MEFAGRLGEVAEVISARIEGWGERNNLNFHINGEAPNSADALDPSLVRAMAMRPFTQGDRVLTQTLGDPLALLACHL